MTTSQLLLELPEGYSFFPSRVKEPEDLYGKLLIWEPPRKTELYVLSADVGDGIGLDRSVVDVTRIGTLTEPDEQVAQFVSDEVDPIALAPIIDAIGHLYTGSDGMEALAAIECNNHGLVTQAELEHHYGYTNFYIWQIEDAADPAKRFTQRKGWYTNVRTRPLILARYIKKLKSYDEFSGLPDYRINSPITMEELRSFVTVGGIREAEADPTIEGAHDDCIMAGAIGLHVGFTMAWEDREPLDAQRRRRAEESRRKLELAERERTKRDYQNTDCSAAEMPTQGWGSSAQWFDDEYDQEG